MLMLIWNLPVTKLSVRIYVDLSDLSSVEHRLNILADIPAVVELVSIEPNEAVVKVK